MKENGLNKWINEWFEQNEEDLNTMMHDIWAHPEVGLKNYFAAETAWQFARTHGFPNAVKSKAGQGVKQCETGNAVVAEFGSGKPVIGIIGELDALPGLGNEDVDHKAPIEGPGQGCGHNLIAGSCMGAACALRYAMEKEGIKGTLRMVECPGEEVGRGKALMAQDGVFKDMDIAIMWHPGGKPFSTEPNHPLCVMAATFEFHGKSAHAAGAPWNGRSALDAVQLTNMGVEFLREHVKDECRVHYQITNGGMAPNIVPDYASVKYFCRAQHIDVVKDLYDRVVKCAEGAAHMTDTVLEPNLIFQIPYFYENKPLCEYMNTIAQQIPDVEYTEEEQTWAKNITADYTGKMPGNIEEVLPAAKKTYDEWAEGTTCTDTADISYFCPTAHIHGGGAVLCTPGHHWTTTACSGTAIGMKAAVRAAKVLAESGFEAFGNQALLDDCWAYFKSLNIPDYDWVYNIPIHDIQEA